MKEDIEITTESQEVEQVRYQITAVECNEAAIAEHIGTMGWRVYATNAPKMRLSLSDAVYEYREEYHIEHGFGRFKGVPLSIAPMFVQRNDQVAGLTYLAPSGCACVNPYGVCGSSLFEEPRAESS
jgi:transposase